MGPELLAFGLGVFTSEVSNGMTSVHSDIVPAQRQYSAGESVRDCAWFVKLCNHCHPCVLEPRQVAIEKTVAQ